MSNVDLVSFWYGVLVGVAVTGLGTAWPMWRRQSRMNREMVETLSTLRTQHGPGSETESNEGKR